jgi:predicted nucleic-acid-binding Zn-ribbon protein
MEQTTHKTNEFTMAWTPEVIQCTKCGSLMAFYLSSERCIKCGTARAGEIQITQPMTDEILHPVIESRKPRNIHKVPHNCEFIHRDGSMCGLEFMRVIGRDRLYCDPHSRIMVNRTTARNRKERGIPASTKSSKQYICASCKLPIPPGKQALKIKGEEKRYHYQCFIKGQKEN